jgi:hypothetical protein
MINISKCVTAEQVLNILRNKKDYFVEIDHCYPEALHPNDRAEIHLSVDYFRDHISLSDVEDEMEDWKFIHEMPIQEEAQLIASHILDSNADHGVYNTVTVFLTPIEQLNN